MTRRAARLAMPAPHTPGYDRLVGVGFALLALGGFWLAGSHLAGVLNGIAEGRPIAVMRLMAAAPFAALILGLMAAMLLVQPGARAQRRIWWAIFACLPGLAIGPIAAGAMTQSALPKQGYAKCESGPSGGRTVTHWARSVADCPSRAN